MTLALALLGPESIWIVADRRLSYPGRPPRDDARKTAILHATDGKALLAYAGLGATARGTEPADWMCAALRSRKLSVVDAIGTISAAMRREFPAHMTGAIPYHHFLAACYVGREPRLYTVDFAPGRPGWPTYHRYTQHVSDWHSRVKTYPRFGLIGTGGLYLSKRKTLVGRRLLHMLRAHDRGKVSALAVADEIAVINYDVHKGLADKTVGPRCVVSWLFRPGGAHRGEGGSQFYTGLRRDPASSPTVPSIDVNLGYDINLLDQVMRSQAEKHFRAWSGSPRGGDFAVSFQATFSGMGEAVVEEYNHIEPKADWKLR